jgi:membrane associated rhomboid family serine protease
VEGEWWRAVTALTLHADAGHVLGNVLAATLFAGALGRRYGAGVAVAALVAAGTLGNLANAFLHRAGHDSVGASTAVFGAVGLLAALRIAGAGRSGSRARRWWVVIAAGLTLLALLGTASHADVLAHLFGFLVGGGLGPLGAFTRRRPLPGWSEGLLVGVAAAAVGGAWRLA